MPREIEFIFDTKTGDTTAETKGITGTDCDKALKKFKLGDVVDEEKTGDYYRSAERSEYMSVKKSTE